MQLNPCLVQLGKMLNLPLRQTLVCFFGTFVFVTTAWAQSDDIGAQKSFVPNLQSLANMAAGFYWDETFLEEYNMTSRHYYTGTFGECIAIQMDISVTGEKVSGHYYYDTVGIPLSLSGNLAKIEEREPKNRVTGVFRGTLAPREKIFEGKWSTPNGKKRLPFKLTKVAEYIFSTIRQGESLKVFSVYPHFLSVSPAWQQINEAVEKSIKKNQTNFLAEEKAYHAEEEIGFRRYRKEVFLIEYYSEELISLLGNIYKYSGGAHGNFCYQTRNFWIKANKAVELKLADLFLPGYGKRLSDYCLNALQMQGASYVGDGGITSFNDNDLSTFSVSPQGVTIHFEPYAVGSHAEGSFTVTVPYKALKGVIAQDGPLKRFIR
jgi:hypothetical protein